MTYYADLNPCDYFGRWDKILIAVGWHERGHPFATGPISEDFFAKLVRMLSTPWEPIAVAGYHRCSFCRFTGGPMELHFEGNTIRLGSSNLFVPGNDGVYVAPSLIAHYIDAHEYCPPLAFQESVLTSPDMKSVSYLKALKSRGLTARHSIG